MLCPSALAHSVHVDAFAEGERTILIEAYYGDGKPVADAAVRVLAEDGTQVLAARTDAQGRYLLQPSGTEPLTVEVVQAGHKGHTVIDGETLAKVVAAADANEGPTPEGAQVPPSGGPGPAESPSSDDASAERAGAAASAPAAIGKAPGPGGPGTVAARTRTQTPSRIVPLIAGVALILAAAALWQVRVLSRRVEQLRKERL